MKNKVTPKSRTKTIRRELIIQGKRGSKSEPTLGNNLIIYSIWLYFLLYYCIGIFKENILTPEVVLKFRLPAGLLTGYAMQ